MTVISCYKCNKPLQLSVGVNYSRSESCPGCLADLHCCKMCQFFDPATYNECREPIAERVIDKGKANFCDLFRSKGGKGSGQSEEEKKKEMIEKANALFKDLKK